MSWLHRHHRVHLHNFRWYFYISGSKFAYISIIANTWVMRCDITRATTSRGSTDFFSFSNLMGPLPPMWSVLTKTSGTSCLCIYDVHYDLQFQASTGVLEHIFHGTWGTPVLICIFPLLHCDNVDNSVILKR